MDALPLLVFVGSLGLLVAGGELLVRGASRLAIAAGMSPLTVGLTVVAYGTSAPEMATSVTAALRAQSDVALGNVVGSNTFNVLFILGASALLSPLVVAQRLVRLEVPLMIVLSLALALLAWDGRLSRLEGILLLVGLVVYTALCIRSTRAESTDLRDEYTRAFGASDRPRAPSLGGSIGAILCGLALLVWGSRWFVDGAVTAARALGISELVIGLTIVAAGTSLPEVVTSLLATYRGERDIAVGNVVGSNIFNILGVLGAAATAADGVAVSPIALRFDLPVMIAVTLACLPVFFTGHRIGRWEGGLLFGYYILYTAFLVLDAADHDALPAFSAVTLAFVLPLTIAGLAASTLHAVMAGQRITRTAALAPPPRSPRPPGA